mmetsp:Transcript_64222/g.140772  ORF Transcript_64222/g.140772 Transcript_64222/m.140772 type:complete len:323 (+) Transcript_64222:864-1832(+)
MSPQDSEHRKGVEDLRRHSLIRQQHQLLNEFIGLALLILRHIRGILRLTVQLEADLLRSQLQGAVVHAPRADLPRQLQQIPQTCGDFGVVLGIIDPRLRLAVGQGLPRFDDGLAEARVHHLCFGRHFPEHGEGQAFHLAAEGTNVGGQQTWKHVSSSLHQVNRGAAFCSLTVDGGVRVDEVGHICDVDADSKVAIGQWLTGDRIVDIFASRRVHRANANVPQVGSTLQIRRPGLPVRRGQAAVDRLAELARDDAVLMENDHAFHIPISNVTQDFGPMSRRVVTESIPAIQNNHDALILQVGGVPCLDHDIWQSGIRRDEDPI